MEDAEFQWWYGRLPEPMLLISPDGGVLAANPAARELFGPWRLSGARLYDVTENTEAKVTRLLSLWQRTGEMLPGALTIRRADGSLADFRVEGAALAGRASRQVLLRFLAKDVATSRFVLLNERIEALNTEIAERRRAETALRRANADLQQFAYSASHDLKEPLRMIAVYCELLQRKYAGQLDDEAHKYLSYAIRGAQRMDMLVRDLLSYTQAVSNDEDAALVQSTEKVLSEAISNLRGAITETSARITVRNLPPALQVKNVHLLQLFQNVIGNAIKYRGEATPVIEVAAHQEGRMWRISIHDNGIGIDPKYVHQVFGLFKRLHSGDDYSGTGLGLAICQKIIGRYGGRIWIESAGQGRGTTVCFTLPSQ